MSQITPARPISTMAVLYKRNMVLTTFCAPRKRIAESQKESAVTAMITRPSCQGWVRIVKPNLDDRSVMKVLTRLPHTRTTKMPGHQAQNPAKKPQNGPKALFVQT